QQQRDDDLEHHHGSRRECYNGGGLSRWDMPNKLRRHARHGRRPPTPGPRRPGGSGSGDHGVPRATRGEDDGARAHQAKNGARYELLASGIKDELDVNAQASLVEQMIAQKVDAIVLAPADSKALVAACKRAIDAGLGVVNIDNRLDAAALTERGLRIPFVGPDNRKGARLVGDYLACSIEPGDP